MGIVSLVLLISFVGLLPSIRLLSLLIVVIPKFHVRVVLFAVPTVIPIATIWTGASTWMEFGSTISNEWCILLPRKYYQLLQRVIMQTVRKQWKLVVMTR